MQGSVGDLKVFKDKTDGKYYLEAMTEDGSARRELAITDKDVRTVFDIVVKLYDQGFTKVQMVAGSDRVKEFETLINKYNVVKGRHGFYEFEGVVKVLSAGERDPDSEGVSGMSASKMRAAAAEGDIPNFVKGLPKSVRYGGNELYHAIRKGLKVKKEGNLTKWQKRRKARTGRY